MAYISPSRGDGPGRCRTCGGRIVRLAHGGPLDAAWYGCAQCSARASLPAPKAPEPLNARQRTLVAEVVQYWKGNITDKTARTALLPEDLERARFWRYVSFMSSDTTPQAEEFVRGLRLSGSSRLWRWLTSQFRRPKQIPAEPMSFQHVPFDVVRTLVGEHLRELMPRWGHSAWTRRDVYWILYKMRDYAGRVPCRDLEYAIKSVFREHLSGSMDH